MSATNHAIVLHRPGGIEELRWEPRAVPAPGPGELEIRHTSIGVNFHDTYVRSGLYKTLPLPGVPGLEAAGVVVRVGPGVTGWAPGDRLSYIDVGYGGYAQARTLKAELALKIPDGIDDEAAACLTIKAMTAVMLLKHTRKVAAGDTILVHAAAGAAGQLVVRLAKHLGATVLATCGTPEKAEIARACGADHVILYRQQSFVERVRELTGGRGVAVAYDSVGADTFDGSLECLDYLGTLVNFGQSSGPVPPFSVSRLAAKSNTLVRPLLFHYIRGRAALEAMAAEAFGYVSAGVLKPNVALRFPLPRAGEAHVALESRATTGSIVLTP